MAEESRCFFEKNMQALSARDPALCAALRAARTEAAAQKAAGKGSPEYRFLRAATGEAVPALPGPGGAARPLHSLANPKREAERLAAAEAGGGAHGGAHSGARGAGFFAFLGLGAGFAPMAALALPGAGGALAIEYGMAGAAELLSALDYSALFGDPRFSLLVDPPPALVESAVLGLYLPALCGGIKALPLRARVERDREKFAAAGEAARRAIARVSADYSVQAHFGERWLANIARNVAAYESLRLGKRAPEAPDAAVCAAGPSLDAQIPILLERRKKGGGPFVISADTALPALAAQGLRPDAVVSIDCQRISLLHFAGMDCRAIPLFLDIASPPELAALSDRVFFFAGAHPLARHLCAKWAPLPALDASGGSVAHACLSLAESLGAKRIAVCGADFSYPGGRIYARGSYVFPFFERRQSRLATLEAQASAFLFRAPFLPPEPGAPPSPPGAGRRYETATLRAYRHSFERKMSEMEAEAAAMPGLGMPLAAAKSPSRAQGGPPPASRRQGHLPQAQPFSKATGAASRRCRPCQRAAPAHTCPACPPRQGRHSRPFCPSWPRSGAAAPSLRRRIC